MSTSTSTASHRASACLLALSIVLAACGTASPAIAPATPTTAATPLGPVNRAAKVPITIGFMHSDPTAESREAANAAAIGVAGYANAYLGGLAGHNIKVVTCEDRATAEGAQACGEQFVREGVTVVAVGAARQIAAALAPLTEAGIPVVINLAGTEAAISTPGVFLLRSTLSVLGTAATYARDNRLTSAAMVTLEFPEFTAPARAVGAPLFSRAGSSMSVLEIGASVTDMRPQIEATERDSPKMYMVVGDATFCTHALTAIREIGSDARIVIVDGCIGEDRAAAVPGGLEGVDVITQGVLDPSDPETALFAHVREIYGEGVGISFDSISGYQAMLSLVRAVNASPPAELTPATVAAAIRQAPATPYPLGGGVTFRCDGLALPQVSPNLCFAAGFLATAHADGTLTDYRQIEYAELFRES